MVKCVIQSMPVCVYIVHVCICGTAYLFIDPLGRGGPLLWFGRKSIGALLDATLRWVHHSLQDVAD